MTSVPDAWVADAGEPLAPGRRALLLAGSTAALLLTGPGVGPDLGAAAPLGAVLALGLWARAATRTGPWRKRLEWVAGAVHGLVLMSWVAYVTPPSLVWIGFGFGWYAVLAGVLLRRLLHHLPAPLAAGLAFTALESLRNELPPPLGVSWLRVGHLVHDSPLLPAVAVFGVAGMTFAMACLGGLAARRVGHGGPARRAARLACGVVPILLVAAAALRPGLAVESGPRVLCVQPGLEQERKQELNQDDDGASARRARDELFDLQLGMTLGALADEAAAGRGVDLVAWGESMLPGVYADPDLFAAVRGDEALVWPVWDPMVADPELFLTLVEQLSAHFLGALRDGRFLAPKGPAAVRARAAGHDAAAVTAATREAVFVAGAILYRSEDGEVRRENAALALGGVLPGSEPAGDLGAPGPRWLASAAKRHLVPGAETAHGLERHAWARALAARLMPYVPDFRAGRATGILPVGDWRVGGAVCFDNAYEDVFVEGVRDGDADLFLVLSNEAWYVESQEFDQMLAMSAVWAASVGRSIVRATNSGISAVIGPDGRVLERLEVEGRDRAVGGALVADVPIPAPDAQGRRPGTPYLRLAGLWTGLWFALPLLLLLLGELLGGRPTRGPSADESLR